MNGKKIAVVAAVGLFAVAGAVLLFTQQGPPPQQRSYDLNVAGSRMDPQTLRANEGDTVTLSVLGDKDMDIHLHGYDVHFLTGPGQKVSKSFAANQSGSFDIEIEATGTVLGRLEVQPRSGLSWLGLGVPAAKASPTAHAGLHHHHGGIQQETTTASYDMLLHFGPLERMYTQAEVDSQHPNGGELILRGDPPPALTDGRHIGVHIFGRSSGKVITDANPTITITDSASPPEIKAPVVVMQALDTGPTDLHYGNNVALIAGHSYTITVQLNGESAVFKVTA